MFSGAHSRGFAPGASSFTSSGQIAKLAEHDKTHVSHQLKSLRLLGLLAVYERGSGSGPYARDRIAARVVRAIPIPPPPP